MSTLYYRIEKLCKANGMTVTSMCKASGASRASLSDLKVGRKQGLSTDTLAKIAKTLGVSVGLLIGEKPEWEDAIDYFGVCWNHEFREKKKADARAIINNDSTSLSAKVEAQTIVFKALFSRSVESCGYNLDHPDFGDYVAMILNQGEGRHGIPVDVYQEMIEMYGKKTGIENGTYYKFSDISQNKMPLVNDDKELTEYLEILKTRPEMRMLFQLSKDATKEDVEAAVRIIEALRNK